MIHFNQRKKQNFIFGKHTYFRGFCRDLFNVKKLQKLIINILNLRIQLFKEKPVWKKLPIHSTSHLYKLYKNIL